MGVVVEAKRTLAQLKIVEVMSDPYIKARPSQFFVYMMSDPYIMSFVLKLLGMLKQWEVPHQCGSVL